MAQPSGIIGDADTTLPQTTVPEEELTNELNLAKFSKTKEYAKLKEHLESRIEFYQTFKPDGTLIATEKIDLTDWKIANTVIAEFQGILKVYENAREVVDEKRNS